MKKTVCLLLVLSLLCSFVPSVCASESPTLYGETTMVQAGNEVTFSVFVSGNRGLSSFRVFLDFNSAILKPVYESEDTLSVTRGALTKSGMMIASPTEQGCQVLWGGGQTEKADGELFSITFEVDPFASGEQVISVSHSAEDTLDWSGSDISFFCEQGSILVETSPVIEVGTAAGFAGDSVTVPVMLHNNPGFATAVLTFEYDTTVLELTAIKRGALLSSSSGSFSRNVDAGKAAWFDSKDINGDGILFELVFTVLAEDGYTENVVSASLTNGSSKNFGNSNNAAIPVAFVDGYAACRNGKLMIKDADILENGMAKLEIKDAPDTELVIVVAAYQTGQMYDAAIEKEKLAIGNNLFSYSHGANVTQVKLFILDAVTLIPLCDALVLQ